MGFDFKQTLHILDGFFVEFSVPESDAHVISLRLSVGKHDGVVEVAPDVFRLDVGEENVRVDS